MNDLDFVTTPELVEELLSRSCFQGVVVWAGDERPSGWQGLKLFHIDVSAALGIDAAGVLKAAGRQVRESQEG